MKQTFEKNNRKACSGYESILSQTAANVKIPSNQNAFAGRTFGLKKRHAIQNDFDTQRTQLLGHVGVEHFARPTLLQANTPALVAQIGRAFRAAKLMAFAYWSLKTQGAA
jgi:hypothetical protein